MPAVVKQFPGFAFALDRRVDRVAGGATDRADDRPGLAADRIEQARLAHIRAADDRQLDRLLAFELVVGGQEANQLYRADRRCRAP